MTVTTVALCSVESADSSLPSSAVGQALKHQNGIGPQTVQLTCHRQLHSPLPTRHGSKKETAIAIETNMGTYKLSLKPSPTVYLEKRELTYF